MDADHRNAVIDNAALLAEQLAQSHDETNLAMVTLREYCQRPETSIASPEEVGRAMVAVECQINHLRTACTHQALMITLLVDRLGEIEERVCAVEFDNASRPDSLGYDDKFRELLMRSISPLLGDNRN